MAQWLTYLLCLVCALFARIRADEANSCSEIANCILWTEGACTAEGTREVCFTTGNSATPGLGDCENGPTDWFDAVCVVADAQTPGDAAANMPGTTSEADTTLCKTVSGGSTVVVGLMDAMGAIAAMNINIRNKDDNALLRTVSCSTFGDDTDVCGLGTSDDYALVSFTVNSCECTCTDWTDWSACGAACGTGEKTRTRVCTPPSSAFICPETIEEARTCDTNLACPVTACVCGDFGEWSDCSITCGQGTQTRAKSCALNTDGSACTPSGVITAEGRSCNMAACPLSCSCDSWSDWGACSAICGGGHQNRTRSCKSAQNPGQACSAGIDTLQSQVCNTNACTPGRCENLCSAWKRSGNCSVTCGSGIREQTRSCPDNSRCPTVLLTVCQVDPECSGAVDGNWGPWMTWGQCSTTDCIGSRVRTRECINPPPSNGGDECTGTPVDRGPCDPVFCALQTTTRRPRRRRPCRFAKNPVLCRRRRRWEMLHG